MRYRVDYQITHDIDWFALYDNIPIHVASNGNIIPKEIDSQTNRTIQQALVEKNIPKTDVVLHHQLIDMLNKTEHPEYYLQSFVEFAGLGFVSIDNHKEFTNEGEFEFRPIIVAYPKLRRNLINIKRINLPCLEPAQMPVLQELDINNLW